MSDEVEIKIAGVPVSDEGDPMGKYFEMMSGRRDLLLGEAKAIVEALKEALAQFMQENVHKPVTPELASELQALIGAKLLHLFRYGIIPCEIPGRAFGVVYKFGEVSVTIPSYLKEVQDLALADPDVSTS